MSLGGGVAFTLTNEHMLLSTLLIMLQRNVNGVPLRAAMLLLRCSIEDIAKNTTVHTIWSKLGGIGLGRPEVPPRTFKN